MEVAIWIVGCVTLVIVMIVAKQVVINALARQIERSLRDEVIEPARKKLNGNNRFILNRDVLQMLYPNQSKQVLDKVWVRLVETHMVHRNPHDDEWCI